MKVLNLRCAHEHRFEGWFASLEDFAGQVERGLLACPVCGDAQVERLPSAPRLNVATPRGESRAPETPASGLSVPTRPASPTAAPLGPAEAVQRVMLQAVRQLIARTEDVGDRFPEEARRIHYGEAEERSIRGKASAEDAEALRDEGIEIVAVPLPEALKGPLQ